MAQGALILDRYEPLGTAGSGGFGTVQIAWDPRIQRKVAIKTIQLTEMDAFKAALPGVQAVAKHSAERHAVASSPAAPEATAVELPWDEPEASPQPGIPADDRENAGEQAWDHIWVSPWERTRAASSDHADAGVAAEGAGVVASSPATKAEQVTSLAHIPGLDEARTAAMLSDPHIVTVFDFEVRERTAYLIMEYVEGITLTRLLREYSEYLTLDMVAGVFDAVAGALMTAHKAGVLHLDIKPDNIIINAEGTAKVTDFGLATLADASGKGTTGGGTIGYMPLEQMRREHLDARTDEWSLAVVVYEMLTGDNPFRARSLADAESAIENAELILPSLCWDDIDEQIDDVVFFALDPDRDERYASVRDFAEEVDKFIGDSERGVKQLSLVVADALGESDDGQPAAVPEDGPDAVGREAAGARRGGFLGFMASLGSTLSQERAPRGDGLAIDGGGDGLAGAEADFGFDDYEDDGYGYEYEYEYDDEPDESARHARDRRDRAARVPLADRVPGPVLAVAPRAFAAVAGAFLAFLAAWNMVQLTTFLGQGGLFVAGIVAAVVAVVGAIRPSFGALGAYCLLGIAVIACGHAIVGTALLVVTALWWYITGREGMANANVALLLPLVGSVGGSSAVPLAAGASLRPVQAGVTAAFVALAAFALGTLGSQTLLGWDALSCWDFTRENMSENARVLAGNISTWATMASWIVSAVVLSVFGLRGKRAGFVIGLALAVSLLLVGSLALAAPTPQLLISVIVATALLFAVV